MFYNNYPIFFDYEEGGGGGGTDPSVTPPAVTEGGGETEGESGNGPYGENGGNGGGSGGQADGSSGQAPALNPYSKSKKIEQDASTVNLDKYIYCYDNARSNAINPNGETRTITVKGPEDVKFSLTITDSSDCSILKEKIEWVSIPAGGKYNFTQDFPSITVRGNAIKKQESYTITLTPEAGVKTDTPTQTLTQTANPTVTITKTTSQTGPALTVGGGIKELTGIANTLVEYTTPKVYTLTITGSDAGTAESLYVKDFNIDKNTTSSNTIKKIVSRPVGETTYTHDLVLKPLTTRKINTTISSTVTKGDDDYIISGDLEVGMVLYAKVEYTKTVKANLNEDGDVLDYLKCNTHTDKFQLDNTHDITTGMSVISKNVVPGTYISSIDCDKNITLLPKQIIKTDSTIKFKKEWWSSISEVTSNMNSDGNACIKLNSSIDIPNSTEIEFSDRNHSILTTGDFLNSGSDSITLNINIHAIKFGSIDNQYTVELDNIITSKPNAYDQDVVVTGDKSSAIYVLRADKDLNATSKTGTVVTTPKHGSVASYDATNDYFVYTPNTGFTGEDSFTFTMSDGVNASDEKTIRITVAKPLRTGGVVLES